MFFTRVGTLIAWLGFIFGLARVGIGFFVASFGEAESRAALALRYLGGDSPGQAIDQGVLIVGIAVALGILTEVSRSLQR